MSIISLFIASTLVIIPIFISYKEKLGLEKEIVVSILRAIVQLIIVGYILDVIFGLKNPICTLILILIMIVNASVNTKKRGRGINKVFTISFVSILIGASVTISILVISGVIKFSPNEIIPIAGMIISNSMIAIGLSYTNLNNSFKNKREEVEVKLSLGADVKEASKSILRDSVKVAIIPTIDSAKTLGIVSLPGMMTGLILAGVSPLTAIKFQIMVTFMMLSASAVSTIIATYLCYKDFFNERKQLKI
ncbi:putative ABC transport system permease protein [Clostridium moniliforme]|uniref:ABC transport system permease protein n=1 Tax=Clostridium moniliforme TaxID=39489 RepID=A0ABS4F3U6_9CLOT|nr:iron export ABC transporter permease subunit FetB [Clostridium moniliforme]MBP1890930.1 putative ABC transport system permease protein [Clostridium moniliforme]